MLAGDRAGKAHWDATWDGQSALRSSVMEGPGRWNHVNRELARFLRRSLDGRSVGTRLVELGCARSAWLPFFVKSLGHSITGVDYSERGCELARGGLAAAGVEGEIVLADFFDPPSQLLGAFDVVFSQGVVEHFDDTTFCVRSFVRFLKPGGRMITIVPNMTGLPGLLQRSLNRAVYDKHVPLDRERLRRAHEDAGLTIRDAGYLVSTNFGVLNLEGISKRTPSFLAKRAVVAALSRVSLLGWTVESKMPRLPQLAAYVYCVADRRA